MADSDGRRHEPAYSRCCDPQRASGPAVAGLRAQARTLSILATADGHFGCCFLSAGPGSVLFDPLWDRSRHQSGELVVDRWVHVSWPDTPRLSPDRHAAPPPRPAAPAQGAAGEVRWNRGAKWALCIEIAAHAALRRQRRGGDAGYTLRALRRMRLRVRRLTPWLAVSPAPGPA